MNFTSIPIVLAITGHRDLLNEDIAALQQLLAKEFLSLKQQYPHTPIQLMSGLAEGADSLVAEIALDTGLELIATLPMALVEYENDFDTPEKLARLKKLISQSIKVLDVTEVIPPKTAERSSYYAALGEYLAERAQCIYALWDGNSENALPGGTADVVSLCKRGITHNENPLAVADICVVRHLRCRRMKNINAWEEHKLNSWAETDVDEYNRLKEIFSSIESFNKSSSQQSVNAANDIAKSRSYLIGTKNYPKAVEPIANLFAVADTLASQKQKHRASALWLISALAFASIFFQQLHLGPNMHWYWLLLHTSLGAIAFLLYRCFFKGNQCSENQYLDWRALAEGLRVQTFWHAAGIQRCVSNYYLANQRDELDWIRHAINNIYFSNPPSSTLLDPLWIKECWLDDQSKYFLHGRNSCNVKESKHKKWTSISRIFFGFGLFSTLTLIPISLLSTLNWVLPWLSLFAAITFVAAGIAKNYSSQMAYQEHSKRYKKMGLLYKRASTQFDLFLNEENSAELQQLLFLTGNEALAENAEWLLIHRQRKFEMPT